ncbi:MAG: restriction endonuclease subunit S [Verrucomicrobiales bacterium]
METFFEKFELFADAPGAVGRMRELVLELAVRGKLVERKESDGNAAKIFSEGRPPEAVSRYEITANWIWIRFAQVGEQRLGKMLDQKGNRGELKPYLRNTNVQWMRFQLDDIKELRLESEELEEYRLLPGDLLICEGGEPGRCAIWREQDREMYFQKAIHRVRPRKGILADYLAICLQVDAKNGVLAKHFTGATIKHFTGRSLSEYSIPLPPLAEQKRIVAKVEELMALCDRLEAQQQEREEQASQLARASLARFADAPTPANLHFLFHPSYAIPPADLRKSILTLAVQGKLVPQDPNDEPADVFLGQIAERLGKPKGKRSSNNGAATADEAKPFDLPPGWAWSRFPDLGEFGRGKSKHRPRNDPSLFVGGTHRLVQTGDVARANGTIRTHTGLYNDVGLSQSKKWPAGTLCITIAANIADSGILGFEACFPDSVVGFIPAEPIPSVRYFEFFMRTAKEHLEQFAPSTAQKNINLGILEQVGIPIPPLAEQRRIVAKVEQLMALVDALETQLAASRATAANLLSALVAELNAA